MKQYLFYATPDAQLLDDEVIEAWVSRVCASGRDYVGDIIEAPSPFSYGLFAGIDGQSYAFLSEKVVQLLDAWGIGLIDERMIDVANSSSSLDSGETVDGEDLLESEGIDK